MRLQERVIWMSVDFYLRILRTNIQKITMEVPHFTRLVYMVDWKYTSSYLRIWLTKILKMITEPHHYTLLAWD